MGLWDCEDCRIEEDCRMKDCRMKDCKIVRL